MPNPLVQFGKKVVDQYGQDVADLLGVDPHKVTFVVDPSLDASHPAEQYGDFVIHLNPDWFNDPANKGQLVGTVIHELAHSYSDTASEPLADGVRYVLTGGAGGWQPSPEAKTEAQNLAARQDSTDAIPPAAPAPGTNTPSELNNAAPLDGSTSDVPGFDLGNLGDSTDTTKKQDPWLQRAYTMYLNLWGEKPPDAWIKKLKDGQLGDSLFEVEDHERAKASFMHTKTAEDEKASYAAHIASALGLR